MTAVVATETLAGSVLVAQAYTEELYGRLVDAARELISSVGNVGSPTVVPIGQAAAAIVGAATALTDGHLRSVYLGSRADFPAKVLIVEAVAVSGMQVRRTAERLRIAGADWVGAFVWRHISPVDSPADWGDVDLLVLGGRQAAHAS